MANLIAGSAGSAGQAPPSASNWASVIHSIVNPFGAPDAPAVTSRWMVADDSSSGEASVGGSSSTGAVDAGCTSRKQLAQASTAVRSGLVIGQGAPGGMSCWL